MIARPLLIESPDAPAMAITAGLPPALALVEIATLPLVDAAGNIVGCRTDARYTGRPGADAADVAAAQADMTPRPPPGCQRADMLMDLQYSADPPAIVQRLDDLIVAEPTADAPGRV
jgi:hypothetical protein